MKSIIFTAFLIAFAHVAQGQRTIRDSSSTNLRAFNSNRVLPDDFRDKVIKATEENKDLLPVIYMDKTGARKHRTRAQMNDAGEVYESRSGLAATYFSNSKTRMLQHTNPLGLSSLFSDAGTLSLIATPDESQIVGSISFKWKEHPDNLYNLSVTAPFSGKKVQPVTFDGLANKASVAFSGYHEFWPKNRKIEIDKDEVQKFIDELNEDPKCVCCEIVKYEDMGDLSKKQLAELQNRLRIRFGIWFLGWGAKIAKQEYDYIDNSLQIQNETKYDYEGKIFGGYRFTNKQSIGLTFSYQSVNSAGDPGTYTFPFSGDITKDEEIYGTTPTRSNNIAAKLEFRAVSRSSKFAINPYAAIDFSRQLIEVKVPIYFFQLRDEDDAFKGLNGGVFVGYVSNAAYDFSVSKKNFQAGVFFGSAFNVTKY